MDCATIIATIKSQYNADNVAGLARFGINSANTYGVPLPVLRQLAKTSGRDHELAGKLWASGIHEARILAGLTDEARLVTQAQMEAWVKDFDSWGICDQVCCNLFDKTPFARTKALEWAKRPEEYVKRAGFVLMAALAVHNKRADDAFFADFLPVIVAGAADDRNFVKKAVNWALRQIGKRNEHLNGLAMLTAQEIHRAGTKAGRWVAADALRELRRRDSHWASGFAPVP